MHTRRLTQTHTHAHTHKHTSTHTHTCSFIEYYVRCSFSTDGWFDCRMCCSMCCGVWIVACATCVFISWSIKSCSPGKQFISFKSQANNLRPSKFYQPRWLQYSQSNNVVQWVVLQCVLQLVAVSVAVLNWVGVVSLHITGCAYALMYVQLVHLATGCAYALMYVQLVHLALGDRVVVCVFSIFNAGGSVCECTRVYTHTHTHTLYRWGTRIWAQGLKWDTWRARRIQMD